MDLLGGAYDSSDSEEEERTNTREEKRVVKFQVPDLKPLHEDEEYRPKKRARDETKATSLFDSLPKPTTELVDFSRAKVEKEERVSKASAATKEEPPARESEEERNVSAGVEAAPFVPTNPNDLYRVGAGGAFNYESYYNRSTYDQQAQAAPQSGLPSTSAAQDAVLELALEEERARKQRRGHRGTGKAPVILEINQSALRGAPSERAESAHNRLQDVVDEGYEERLQKEAGHKPSQMQNRKSQIGSLHHAAKMHELDLLRGKAESMKSKRQTQSKYGW